MQERIHAPELDRAIAWLNTDRPLRLRALRGHVVVLDFWTYCCINCIHTLPVLGALEERHRDDPFVVIGVHSGKFEAERDPARIREAVERYGVHHPVAVDDGMRLWSEYAIRAWPTLVVVRPDGTIAHVSSGEPDLEALDALIARELAAARHAGTLALQPLPFSRTAPARRPLSFPGKVAVAPDGRLAVADSGHHRVVVASPEGRVLAVAGSGRRGLRDGALAEAAFDDPQGLCWDGEHLWVADRRNHALRRIDLASATVRTVAGTGELGGGRSPSGPALARSLALRSPWDVLRDGDTLYVAMAGAHQIWAFDLATETIGPWAGSGVEALIDGPRAAAAFAQPSGLALGRDADGRRWLYVADAETSAVRAIDLEEGRVLTLVGQGLFDFGDVDGPSSETLLQHPLAVASAGADLLVADTYNHKLKRLTLTGRRAVSTVYPIADALPLGEPGGLAQAPDGSWVVADTNHHRLLRLRLASRVSAEVLTLHDLPPPAYGSLEPSGATCSVEAPEGTDCFLPPPAR